MEEKEPYCDECGNEDLAYLGNYPNGENWKCRECNYEFLF